MKPAVHRVQWRLLVLSMLEVEPTVCATRELVGIVDIF